MIKAGIFGATGRMGQAILQRLYLSADCTPIGGTSDIISDKINYKVDGEIFDIPFFDTAEKCAQKADVIIDFSHASILNDNITACKNANTALVIGTTGFDEATGNLINEAAKSIAILQAGNMSVGVNLLSVLTQKAAEILDDSWDIEITEAHHRHKVDSPSGTAFLLGEAAAKGRNKTLKEVQALSRVGQVGARPKGEIGFNVIRAGSIIGEHSVLFGHEDEMITLSHRAQSRKIFANGAVFAAQKIASLPAGRYDMMDILDF